MVALGALNPIDDARAQVQEQIGTFLAARAKLDRLTKNPSLQIQGQAQGLYNNQVALENKLQNEITPLLTAIQSGVWSASDILTLGGFTYSIVDQINRVSNLERQAGGTSPATLFDLSTLAIAVPVILIVGVLGGFVLAKR
jgi:uncharacterized protein YneF (UPF0154 family)